MRPPDYCSRFGNIKSRLYSEHDVERLRAILQLKKFGFTLAEIRSLIKQCGILVRRRAKNHSGV